MFKKFLIAAVTLLFSASIFAAGPSPIWRLEVTRGAEGIVEIAEIKLFTTSGGSNVTDLIRLYPHEQTVGSTDWTITHNLDVQVDRTTATVVATKADPEWSALTVTVAAEPPADPAVGDFWYNTGTSELKRYNGVVFYAITYTDSATAPATPLDGDLWYKSDTEELFEWLEVPPAEPTSIVPLDNNSLQVTFDDPAVGEASVRGISFDTPASDRPGRAFPPVAGLENRPAAAAWDNNTASYFRSSRAPSQRAPLGIQYTFWIGDPDRYPNVVEYSITVRKTETAPAEWRLLYWKDGQWVVADQQAGFKFAEGETRTFEVD